MCQFVRFRPDAPGGIRRGDPQQHDIVFGVSQAACPFRLVQHRLLHVIGAFVDVQVDLAIGCDTGRGSQLVKGIGRTGEQTIGEALRP